MGRAPQPCLTFIVCGVRREADVHRPFHRTIEAVRVRAGVTEAWGRGSEHQVGIPFALTQRDTHTHTWTRMQTLRTTGVDRCTETRGHKKTQTQTNTRQAQMCRHLETHTDTLHPRLRGPTRGLWCLLPQTPYGSCYKCGHLTGQMLPGLGAHVPTCPRELSQLQAEPTAGTGRE